MNAHLLSAIVILLSLIALVLVVISITLGRVLSTLTLIMLNASRIRQNTTPPHMLDYQPPATEVTPEPDYTRHPDSNFPDVNDDG